MAISTENSDFSPDETDVEILRNIEILLEQAGVKGITGVGPVDLEKGSVTVLLENQKEAALPRRLEFTLSNKLNVAINLVAEQDDTPAELLLGPMPQPWPQPAQYAGPLMGGDPIWNDAASMWGTITFVVGQRSSITIEGKSCANQSLTCSHVLDFGGPDSVSTTRFPMSMKLAWTSQPPVGTKWIDVAGAEMEPGLDFSPLEVRGLGKIVGAKQPRRGIRVSKYGATSGLTSGQDHGWTRRKLWPGDPRRYWVRRVGGYFATRGDSGAPVLDADRNLVGLIIAGKPGRVNETYYIQVLPSGEVPLPRVPAASIPDLSCFEIDGL